MAYNTNDFRGTAGDGIRVKNDQGQSLFDSIRASLEAKLEERGTPARISCNTVKSGGFFGTKTPILIISHPNPPTRFFDIGVVVNGNMVSFPLLGESEQNTKMNKLEDLRAQGKLVRSWMVKPDEFIYQQELSWRTEVLEVIYSLFQ